MPKTKQEDSFISDFMSRNGFESIYIGLTYNRTSGKHRWDDGDLVNWENWRQGQPNYNEENACTGHFLGNWSVVPCNTPMEYICVT
jgi:hypothetical protein